MTTSLKSLSKCLLTGILLVACTFITSCKEDFIITDVSPVGVMISIQDAEGNNLLDPNTAGNWVGEKFQAEYKGEIYEPDWTNIQKSPSTRYYMPFFAGLQYTSYLVEDPESGEWMKYPAFYFGEFDGAENQNVEFDLIIPGTDRIEHIKMQYKYKGFNKKSTTRIYLNGKEQKEYPIVLILPARLPE